MKKPRFHFRWMPVWISVRRSNTALEYANLHFIQRKPILLRWRKRLRAGSGNYRRQPDSHGETDRQTATGSHEPQRQDWKPHICGLPPGGRRKTTFDLNTLLTTWAPGTSAPSYGPLFQAALGAAPLTFPGGTAAPGSTATTLRFAGPHGLLTGQAVTYLGELRFVAAIIDAASVQLNAPLSTVPLTGASIGPTATYLPSTNLPSVSVFDYWAPSSAAHRILCGAGVDQMTVKVNGDFHEFSFSGMAQELVDSTSFSSGIGQLSSFPPEPALAAFDYSIVPGHLGQVWLGITPIASLR